MSYAQCPLCGADIGDADAIWEHLLCYCSGSEHVAEDMGLQFLRPACRALGVSLLLYSMSHHVATFIWALLQHVHHQHHAGPVLMVGGYTACRIPLVQSANGNGNGIPFSFVSVKKNLPSSVNFR